MTDWHVARAAFDCFDEWAELSERARPGWLADLAARDPPVHARLLALIEADERARSEPSDAAPPSDGDLTGTYVGVWRVERSIGKGSAAQVWLARRSDGVYDDLAAIKLTPPGPTDTSSNERFSREVRTLKRLSHPNIARLLDAGVTASGQRYLVFEYVDGTRIDSWCEQHALSVAARIALLVTVCRALGYGHQNLIAHLDLKASNVFVTLDGTVKLLDFGVAKLLADIPSSVTTEMTVLGGLVQELLAGAHGDAAAVVAKANSSTPAGHYRSAPELADDLQRVLDHLPVFARPDTLLYRSSLYVRRHRLGVAIGAAIVIAVIIGLVGIAANARMPSRSIPSRADASPHSRAFAHELGIFGRGQLQMSQ